MICRIWHGWTAPRNADVCEHLLREEVFKGIHARALLSRFDERSAHFEVRVPYA